MAKIKDICEILDFKRVPITASDRKSGIYPYYGANGIQDHVDDYIFDDELVLLAEDGGYFGSSERPIAYRVSGKCWVNNHAHVLKPKDVVDVDYLCYSLMFRDVSSIVNGATRQKLTQADMKEIDIPVPPLIEQHAIVQILNKVFGLISLRKQQLSKLDELVKARFAEMFGDAEHNTMNWPTAKLSSLCDVGSSKRIYQSELTENGVPFLRISDLNERIDGENNEPQLFIPKAKFDELKSNGLVPSVGDILVTARGTLGRCYIVKVEDSFYFQDGMISWLSDINESLTSLYISELFATTGIHKQIANFQAGSTVAYLSIAMLKKLDIMIPPKALQQQFAAFVEQTDKSKFEIQKNLEKLETLKKALMQKYFSSQKINSSNN